MVGSRRIPMTGPALLIANHQSFFDAPVIGNATMRHLSFLARKSLFRNRWFGWLIDALNAVPVDQEGIGKDGIKEILAQLQAGRAVVVFPEGERSTNARMQPLKPGISLLIKRVQAPIIPIGIAGAYDCWPRTQRLPNVAPLFPRTGQGTLAICIGEPLDGKRFANMPRDQMLHELFVEIQKVQQQAEQLRDR